jgi:hypothetical protein
MMVAKGKFIVHAASRLLPVVLGLLLLQALPWAVAGAEGPLSPVHPDDREALQTEWSAPSSQKAQSLQEAPRRWWRWPFRNGAVDTEETRAPEDKRQKTGKAGRVGKKDTNGPPRTLPPVADPLVRLPNRVQLPGGSWLPLGIYQAKVSPGGQRAPETLTVTLCLRGRPVGEVAVGRIGKAPPGKDISASSPAEPRRFGDFSIKPSSAKEEAPASRYRVAARRLSDGVVLEVSDGQWVYQSVRLPVWPGGAF